jgi:membrane associated rhomboid family serine protease
MPWSESRFEQPAPPPVPPEPPRRSEPILNAPVLPLLIALSMAALYMGQTRLPDQGLAWAFRPLDLIDGHWVTLFTSMLLHGGWAHVAMNAVAALAFGAPVARLLGQGARGGLAFLLFYVMCGVVAALGYGLVHWGGPESVVGASGAVFGLIGAAVRLLATPGRLSPLLDRRALGAAAAWMGVNLIVGLIGFMPGAGGARIAWEAHAFGFIAGYLTIGLLCRLIGRGRFDSRARLGDPET